MGEGLEGITSLIVKECARRDIAGVKDMSAKTARVDGTATLADAIGERDWQRVVTDYATLCSWRWVHARPALTSKGWRTALSGSPGAPDLMFVRGSRIVFAELKSSKGKTTAAQDEWLAALAMTAAEVYLWTPAQFDEMISVLT